MERRDHYPNLEEDALSSNCIYRRLQGMIPIISALYPRNHSRWEGKAGVALWYSYSIERTPQKSTAIEKKVHIAAEPVSLSVTSYTQGKREKISYALSDTETLLIRQQRSQGWFGKQDYEEQSVPVASVDCLLHLSPWYELCRDHLLTVLEGMTNRSTPVRMIRVFPQAASDQRKLRERLESREVQDAFTTFFQSESDATGRHLRIPPDTMSDAKLLFLFEQALQLPVPPVQE